LKGGRDSIPVLRRKGIVERKRPEKISHFFLVRKIICINFVVPKAKKMIPKGINRIERKSSFAKASEDTVL
jgi:hypothetical protein